jgi:hypothetical protein
MELSVLAILIASFVILLFLLWVTHFCKRYVMVMLLGFGVRLAFISIQEQTRAFNNGDINDFLPYYSAFEVAMREGNILGFIQPHAAFYTALYAGWIFSVIGEPGFWVERVINSLLGVSIIAPLAWMHQSVFQKKMSQFQACLLVLWPSWIVHTVYIGRTALSVISVLVSLAILFDLLRTKGTTKTPWLWIGLIVSILLVCMLRIHEVAYFIPVFSLGLFNCINRLKKLTYIRPFLYGVAFLISVPISVSILGFYQQMIEGRYRLEGDSLENAVSIAKGGEFGGSLYLEGIYPTTLLDWIWYLPLQGFHFLFSPMPWSIHTPFVAISSLQAWIVLLLCCYGFYKARKVMWNNSLLRLLIITLLFTSLAFGSGVKNAGSAERWRMPLTLTLIMVSTRLIASSTKRTAQNSDPFLEFERR